MAVFKDGQDIKFLIKAALSLIAALGASAERLSQFDEPLVIVLLGARLAKSPCDQSGEWNRALALPSDRRLKSRSWV
jgi:hypothetical protein